MLEEVLLAYGIGTTAKIQIHGTGLIHNTWKVNDGSADYVLQRINHDVFKKPDYISSNIEAIASWLKKNHPDYFFVTPLSTTNNGMLLHIPSQGYFRLFPFVKESVTYDIAQTPQQAFEAARQFARFTYVLKDFPVSELKVTLPDFHNLSTRYKQFERAVKMGNPPRIKQSSEQIDYLRSQNHIVSTYEEIVSGKEFKTRVTHHDTKISNVLFDKTGHGICVIDLDTVMPGYFISDVGDMLRTYLSPASEEERDFEKIRVRVDYFESIAQGYLSEMGGELTRAELDHFVYSGMFMIYMQALRFLADHLNNDVYYGAAYEGHNYVRGQNQVILLQRLLEKKDELNKIVSVIGPNRY